MPSLSETLGFVVLEAMSSGVPAVAIKAGGIPGLIQDGITGLLSNADEPQAFRENVMKLISDKFLRERIGVAARKYAKTLDWNAATQKLYKIQYLTAIRLHRNKKIGKFFTSRNDESDNKILADMKSEEEAFSMDPTH